VRYFKREAKSPRSSIPLYMFDWVLLNNCPELGQTLTIPKYVVRDAQKLLLSDDGLRAITLKAEAGASWPSLFMSPSSLQGSGLHVDGGNSSFWMLLARGRKRWRIVDAKDVKYLGPREIHDAIRLGADLFEPDFHEFPGLAQIDIWEADMRPGDLIIVPGGSAHQVQNLAPSLAIAGNYISPHGMRRHQQYLQHILQTRLGDEKEWPEHLRRGIRMFGDQRFFKDVDAVFPETDVSFEDYHAGFSVAGW